MNDKTYKDEVFTKRDGHYSIEINGKVEAEVSFAPFFIELANYKNEVEFERCYNADLRDLIEKFKQVYRNYEVINRLVTTF